MESIMRIRSVWLPKSLSLSLWVSCLLSSAACQLALEDEQELAGEDLELDEGDEQTGTVDHPLLAEEIAEIPVADDLAAVAADPALAGTVHWAIRLNAGMTSSRWGDGNAPDLYVTLGSTAAGVSARSTVAFNDFTPTWFETLVPLRPMSDTAARDFRFSAWDHDSNADDFIGVRWLTPAIDAAIRDAADSPTGSGTATVLFTVHAATNSRISLTVWRRRL
jgi:hypothetical protein